jgi:putative transcriptional regulator
LACVLPYYLNQAVVNAPIIVHLDVMLARRKWRLNDLAAAVDITPQNLSVLKAGRAKAIRFSTLEAICRVLDCQPADLLEYQLETPTHPKPIPTPYPPDVITDPTA